MNGLPTQEQIDAANGIIRTKEKCPKCGAELFNFQGGDQGDSSFDYCEHCNYKKY